MKKNLDITNGKKYSICNMKKNLDITNGIFFSQRVLLELTSVGFTREQAYVLVQKNAMLTWKNKSSFLPSIEKSVE